MAPGHPKLVDGRSPRVPGLVVKSSIGMGGYNTAVVISNPND
jgi:3-oxoacyl-[acyl-carrier-protein] synthase II